MQILVAGGRGFIGRHIVAALLRSRPEDRVHILSREGNRAADEDIKVRQGDVTDPATLPAACAGIDVVIHCVQFPNHPVEHPRKGWTYLRVDGEGTRTMVAAAAAAGVKRFIYISGAGTGPDRAESWFRAKWMAESAIRGSGMEYVIFRPSLVYGPEDRSLNRFIAMVKRLPIIPVIGDGQQRLNPVHVDDLATLVAQAVALPAAHNQVFDIGGAEYTMDGLLYEIGTLLKKNVRLLHIPKPLVKFAAAVLQYLPRRPLTPSAVDFITMDVTVDTTKTRQVFAWTPQPLSKHIVIT